MEYVDLGRSELKVSVVGVGAWQWGSREWGWEETYGKKDVIGSLRRAVDLGINLIDTAEAYGRGKSEALIGEALTERREQFVIASKVSPWHLHPTGVRKAVERSLRRLRTSVIDLYQIHWPNPLMPIGATMRAMEKLVDEGKIRYIGVSNFSLRRLIGAREALSKSDIVSNQVRYNLLQPKTGRELLDYARREKISLIAYSPLAQGALTGKYSPFNLPKDVVRTFNPFFSPRNLEGISQLLDVLKIIGERRGRTAGQVALNWLIKDPEVIPIPGVKTRQQIEDNAGAAGWRLTGEELGEIGAATEKVAVDRFRRLPVQLIRGLSRLKEFW